MLAKIYQPSRNAMQRPDRRGRGTGCWNSFRPTPRSSTRSWGWTGSDDMNAQSASAFPPARKPSPTLIAMQLYEVFEPKRRGYVLRQNGYGDNFASGRRTAWRTH